MIKRTRLERSAFARVLPHVAYDSSLGCAMLIPRFDLTAKELTLVQEHIGKCHKLLARSQLLEVMYIRKNTYVVAYSATGESPVWRFDGRQILEEICAEYLDRN